jgi:hypothetical protein
MRKHLKLKSHQGRSCWWVMYVSWQALTSL